MQIRRREFVAGLAASALFAPLWTHAQDARRRPRLLIAEEDPFTGLALLRTRYAAGRRPSNDMLGWALSWRLTGQGSFADRALAEIRSKRLPAGARSLVRTLLPSKSLLTGNNTENSQNSDARIGQNSLQLALLERLSSGRPKSEQGIYLGRIRESGFPAVSTRPRWETRGRSFNFRVAD